MLELMAMVYVAVGVLFLVNPDWLILVVNQVFARYEWPVVFFPTERFWLSLAVSVPGTRAFLAFAAARNPRSPPGAGCGCKRSARQRPG